MEETIKEVVTETPKVQEAESPLQVILDAVPESKKKEVTGKMAVQKDLAQKSKDQEQ